MIEQSNIEGFSRPVRILVPDIGQIGAGSTVEFLPSVKKCKIPRPRDLRICEDLVSGRVCGDSLRDDGILDGDRVTCRLSFELSEISQGQLVVIKLPCGALALKHFYVTDHGCVRLACANPYYQDLYFELEDIEIKALVVESIRSWL